MNASRSDERARALFRATYDPEAEAVYVYLSSKPHARTVEVTDEVNVDLDADGAPIGVEVQVALGAEGLRAALEIEPEVAAQPKGRNKRLWWRLGWYSALAVARDRLDAPPSPAEPGSAKQ